MAKKNELLSHLRTYLKRIQEAHEILCHYYQIESPIQAARSGQIPRQALLEMEDRKRFQYGFHGFGCWIAWEDQGVGLDYEYDYSGKLTGFKHTFFLDYLRAIGSYEELPDPISQIKKDFAEWVHSEGMVELFYNEWGIPFYRLKEL